MAFFKSILLMFFLLFLYLYVKLAYHFYVQKENRTISGTVHVASRRPILAGSDPPTTFGAIELNFCVRYGNRCGLNAIVTTRYLIEKCLGLSKLNHNL